MIARALAVILLAAIASSQELVRIEAKVVSTSGTSVYLDRGREAGVRIDDAVLLHPPGGPTVDATVRDVSKSTSRAELAPGSSSVPAGSRAEILVPKDRIATPAIPPAAEAPVPSPAPSPPPPHPGWTHPPEAWNEETPLLAPAYAAARDPEDLPAHFDGRVFWQANSTWNQENQDARYLLGSMGADLRLENPFGKSGAFEFRGDFLTTNASFSGASDDTETDVAIRRLSYSQGGTKDDPARWELGRFLQREFPELGVLDGFDWSRRTEGGSRFGASVGAMPEPFPSMDTGEDLQASLYYRWAPDRSEKLLLGGAYQNTWHDGDQDRNLFLGTLEWNPRKSFTLRSTAWVDYYGSEDTIKSSAFELTELHVLAGWRFERKGGITATASHRRIPEILRLEFSGYTPQQIEDDELDRIGLGGWTALGEKTRLRAQTDAWRDQDDEGMRGEVGISRRDLLWSRGEIGFALYTAEGSYSSGEGLRLTATKSFDRTFLSLGYEFAEYDQKGFVGTQATLAHQALYGNVDLELGKGWSLSLLGNRQFGDELDAYTLGFLLQLSF
ncbi:MAG: hypothetical protein ACKVXR_12215 [Planctomycetota bacterium]